MDISSSVGTENAFCSRNTHSSILNISVYLDWSSLLWSKQRLIVCRILHLIFWSWSVILMSVGDIIGQLTAICSWPSKVSVWLLHAHFCVFQNVWLLPGCGCTRPPVRVSVWPAVVFKSNHFYCHITTAHVPWWVKFLRACSRQYRNNLHMDSTYLQTYTDESCCVNKDIKGYCRWHWRNLSTAPIKCWFWCCKWKFLCN